MFVATTIFRSSPGAKTRCCSPELRRPKSGTISTCRAELTAARSALASSDQQLGSLRVDLFKTLGGGWADLPPAS